MAAHILWSLLNGLGPVSSSMPAAGASAPTSPSSSPTGTEELNLQDHGLGCDCSAVMRCLRCLHIEGLPVTVSAADLSTLMAPYGRVQYAEAAPYAVGNSGTMTQSLHGYVVFADHPSACQAKRVLQPQWVEQPAVVQGLRVRFCRPHSVVPLCTPDLRSFVASQWAQSAAVGKASPDQRKPNCRLNALFICKLHQHITTARLSSLFGKFGRMLACEVQYHSDGRSAGHGVVIYESIDDAEQALACTNGYRLEGRMIEVTPLRLKKLPSKLEHLKDRIKRQAVPGEASGSEDGTASMPDCTPRSSRGTPGTSAAEAPAAAGCVRQWPLPQQQLQQAAAGPAAQLVQQIMFQQIQQQMWMQASMPQQAWMPDSMPPGMSVDHNKMCAATGGCVGCYDTAGLHPSVAAVVLPHTLAAAHDAAGVHGLSNADCRKHLRQRGDGVVPTGLDLSFIS